MGKSRRNRGGTTHRRDPIAKPTQPPSDPELAALRQSKILPIVNDLQSSNPTARSSAASAISNIVQDTKCRKLLLRERIVHTLLTQTLTDSAVESRAAGWGILQVLAEEEEPDFCVHLFRSDILTAMEFACKNVSKHLTSKERPFTKLPKAEQEFVGRIASSLVSLVTNLTGANDDILESVSTKTPIINLLELLVSHESITDRIPGLKNDTLACLMNLTEDNEIMAKYFVAVDNFGFHDRLMTLDVKSQAEDVLTCGVLHNLYATIQASKPLSKQIQVNDSVLLPRLSKAIATIGLHHPVVNGGEGNSSFECQQLALEVIADIGTSLNSSNMEPMPKPKLNGNEKGRDQVEKEGEEDDEMQDQDEEEDEEEKGREEDDDEGAEEGDEMDEDELEADMDLVTGPDQPDDSIEDLPTLRIIINNVVPELIRILNIQSADEDMIRLQGHALAALSNISWSVSLFDFLDASNDGIKKTWSPIGQAIWQNVITPTLSSDTADVALAAQITSLAWAVARTLGHQTPLQPGEYHKFVTLYETTSGTEETQQHGDDPFQALGVKCIGLLGQLAMDPAPLPVNQEIGSFLMNSITRLPEASAAVVVEGLNQIFDIYGNEEKPCEEVFRTGKFLDQLVQVQPKVKAMLKSINKNKYPELRLRAEEAALNLNRFIAYKRKHQPQT